MMSLFINRDLFPVHVFKQRDSQLDVYLKSTLNSSLNQGIDSGRCAQGFILNNTCLTNQLNNGATTPQELDMLNMI